MLSMGWDGLHESKSNRSDLSQTHNQFNHKSMIFFLFRILSLSWDCNHKSTESGEETQTECMHLTYKSVACFSAFYSHSPLLVCAYTCLCTFSSYRIHKDA